MDGTRPYVLAILLKSLLAFAKASAVIANVPTGQRYDSKQKTFSGSASGWWLHKRTGDMNKPSPMHTSIAIRVLCMVAVGVVVLKIDGGSNPDLCSRTALPACPGSRWAGDYPVAQPFHFLHQTIGEIVGVRRQAGSPVLLGPTRFASFFYCIDPANAKDESSALVEALPQDETPPSQGLLCSADLLRIILVQRTYSASLEIVPKEVL